MDHSRRMKITNKKQFDLLISLLEKYPYASKGFKYAEDSNSFLNIWENITSKLNGEGPPLRQSIGWQKVWNDFKLKTKKKLEYNKEMNATNEPHRLKNITDIEERVINLLSLNKMVDRQIENFEISFLENSSACTSTSNFEIDSQSISEETFFTDTPINGNVNLVGKIVEPKEQTRKKHKKFKKEINGNNSLLSNESKEADKLTLEIRYHLRKMVKLKKEKLKILKEREERDKIESELKLQILFLEKTKLEKELGMTKMDDFIY